MLYLAFVTPDVKEAACNKIQFLVTKNQVLFLHKNEQVLGWCSHSVTLWGTCIFFYQFQAGGTCSWGGPSAGAWSPRTPLVTSWRLEFLAGTVLSFCH